MTSQPNPRHLVILIHGTWAQDAIWCQYGSGCRQSLMRALGQDTLFSVFEWSAKNSADQRLSSAEALAAHIHDLRSKFPAARLHVIAHSHGGNIAFYAARNARIAAAINSVACLATPFLHAMPRKLGHSLGSKLEYLISIAVLAIIILIWSWIWPESVKSVVRVAKSNYALLVLIPAMIVVALGVRKLFLPAWRAAYSSSRAFGRRLQLPTSVPFPTLIVRGAGDEAAGILGAAQLINAALLRVVHILISAVPGDVPSGKHSSRVGRSHAAQRKPLSVRIGIGVFVAGWVILVLVFGLPGAGAVLSVFSPTSIAFIMVGCWMVGLLLMVASEVVQFLAAPVVLLLIVLMGMTLFIPFGWRIALSTVGLNVSAEPTPPGTWTVVQLPHPTNIEQMRDLNHAIHSNPALFDALETWYRHQVTVDFGAYRCESPGEIET
ncbi:MAG: hypothetical protein JWO52_5242 [Gammaproteobacteria bacterium]|nr:hypothetical protein [Gammaproteobacteria bacterium]